MSASRAAAPSVSDGSAASARRKASAAASRRPSRCLVSPRANSAAGQSGNSLQRLLEHVRGRFEIAVYGRGLAVGVAPIGEQVAGSKRVAGAVMISLGRRGAAGMAD